MDIKVKYPAITLLVFLCALAGTQASDERPNILFCISDDQSYTHTGANGDPAKFATYTQLLAEAGYSAGYTGKGTQEDQ